jgi:hypothetical protein
MIPIEVKIFASDQDEQCSDYAKTRNNSDLFYLTLDGRLPGENSAEGLKPIKEDGEIIGYEGLRTISFCGDVINWLNKCLALPETIKIAPIREILLQFKDILLKLTGKTEGGAKMEIVNKLMMSAENMKSAIDIESALPQAKAGVMLNLFRELRRGFESKGKRVIGYEETCINEYYTSRKQLYPGFCVEIAKIADDITAVLYVEVYWNLYFGFAFVDEKTGILPLQYMEKTSVKRKYPKEYAAYSSIITEVMGKGGSSETSVYYANILDESAQIYDFKNFSPSCVDLTLNYADRAQRICDKLSFYIHSVVSKM